MQVGILPACFYFWCMNTEQLQDFCMSLPGTEEGIKWEDRLCFMIAERMFCITGFNDNSNITFKIAPEEFDILTERDGVVQAKYFARRQWVSVEKRNALKKKEWEEYLTKSYELVKSKLPKKIQREIEEAKK